MLKLVTKSRKRDISMSATIRRLLRKVLSEDEEAVDAALDTEMIMQRHARDTRDLASRLARLLVALLYDVGQIKALDNNILGMQKGMTEQMHKDILQDADRQTKRNLSRANPELTPFIDAIERWLRQGEDEESAGKTNGHSGKGGRPV
jgi:molecular chaperone GrpE (heat shock protein)